MSGFGVIVMTLVLCVSLYCVGYIILYIITSKEYLDNLFKLGWSYVIAESCFLGICFYLIILIGWMLFNL